MARLRLQLASVMAPLRSAWRAWRRRKSLGERGERAAAKFLRRKRYVIVARSQRMRLGEIDLIAVDGDTLVFVEVKTRKSCDAGHPAEAVTPRKQAKLTQLAQVYRKRHQLDRTPSRFDVVAVTWAEESRQPRIDHYVNAFQAIEEPF